MLKGSNEVGSYNQTEFDRNNKLNIWESMCAASIWMQIGSWPIH